MLDGVLPQIGKESTFQALGQTWTLSRQEMDIWDELYEWAKRRLPDPFAGLDQLAARLEGITDPAHPLVQMYERKFTEAQEKAAALNSINSPLIMAIIDGTPEGMIQRFWLLLKIKHPDITKTTAAQIAAEIGPRMQAELTEKANGKVEDPLAVSPGSIAVAGNGQEPDRSTGTPSSKGSSRTSRPRSKANPLASFGE